MEADIINTGRGEATNAETSIALAKANDTTEPVLFSAEVRLGFEIEQALSGENARQGVDRARILTSCRVVDYWLAEDTTPLIAGLGLIGLAQEIKCDYVLASLLAWRGEYKLGCITLRSFIESFCLLLYYLNQGCDRLLYLKGKGYKLMLHRMAQKRQDPEDTHAFRRHYELLIVEGNSEQFAKKFFEEVGDCYSILSKAVHGDFSQKAGKTPQDSFMGVVERVLRICNTLALHDPMMDATEDDLEKALEGVLEPATFTLKAK